MHRTAARYVIAVLALALAAGAAFAGTISVAWNAVSDSDLAGYKVYYGTASGSYTSSISVGNVTNATLSSLDPSTRYYIAVKAVDSAGLESAAYSNEIVGLPRPVVSSVSPASVQQSTSATLVIAGESFDAGAAVAISGSGVTIAAVRRDSVSQLSVDVTIDASAAAGTRDITVTNPDSSYGVKSASLTIVANSAPTVASTAPADAATAIAADAKPTVTFSEALSAASVTSATVQLLDASGNQIAQAAGSPSLSADLKTVTITPAAALAENATYRIKVVGGASGVKDSTGLALAADYVQTTGFKVVNKAPSVVGGFRRNDTH